MIRIKLTLAAIVMTIVTSSASAQFNPYFRPDGNLINNSFNPAVPFGRNFSNNSFVAPPFGFSPFYNNQGSYLSGAADVINAQGNYLNARQQALQARQGVKQSEIDTRRKLFDQRMYEMKNTPTSNQIRERNRQLQFERAMNSPPTTEVVGGSSLNTILSNLQSFGISSSMGPVIPIPQTVLNRINLASTSSNGTTTSTAMLRGAGKISWPFSLQEPMFDKLREAIDTQFAQAFNEASNGNLQAAIFRDLTASVSALDGKVRTSANVMSAPDFIEARQFTTSLTSSVNALRDPKLVQTANAGQKLEGTTVAEVVDFMTRNGLTFAPANDGDGGVYMALHQSFVTYSNLVMSSLQARGPAPMPPKE